MILLHNDGWVFSYARQPSYHPKIENLSVTILEACLSTVLESQSLTSCVTIIRYVII